MSLWTRFKGFFNKYRPVSTALAFYVFVDLMDILSSALCRFNPNAYEVNPYARDAGYQFLIGHGFVLKAGFLFFVLATLYVLWDFLNVFVSRRMADLVVWAYLFLSSFFLLWQIVIKNFLIATRWYTL